MLKVSISLTFLKLRKSFEKILNDINIRKHTIKFQHLKNAFYQGWIKNILINLLWSKLGGFTFQLENRS